MQVVKKRFITFTENLGGFIAHEAVEKVWGRTV